MAEKNAILSMVGHLAQLLSGFSSPDGGGIGNVGVLLSHDDEIKTDALIGAVQEDRNKVGGPGDGDAIACAVRDLLVWLFPEGGIIRWARKTLAGNRFRKHILSLTFIPPARARAERRDRWGVIEDAVPENPGRDDRKAAIVFMGEWILHGRSRGTPDETIFKSLVMELRRRGYPVGLPEETERTINAALAPGFLFSWRFWILLLIIFLAMAGVTCCSSCTSPYA